MRYFELQGWHRHYKRWVYMGRFYTLADAKSYRYALKGHQDCYRILSPDGEVVDPPGEPTYEMLIDPKGIRWK